MSLKRSSCLVMSIFCVLSILMQTVHSSSIAPYLVDNDLERQSREESGEEIPNEGSEGEVPIEMQGAAHQGIGIESSLENSKTIFNLSRFSLESSSRESVLKNKKKQRKDHVKSVCSCLVSKIILAGIGVIISQYIGNFLFASMSGHPSDLSESLSVCLNTLQSCQEQAFIAGNASLFLSEVIMVIKANSMLASDFIVAIAAQRSLAKEFQELFVNFSRYEANQQELLYFVDQQGSALTSISDDIGLLESNVSLFERSQEEMRNMQTQQIMVLGEIALAGFNLTRGQSEILRHLGVLNDMDNSSSK